MHIFQNSILYISLLLYYSFSLISIPFKSINLLKPKNSNFFIESLSNEIYINLTLSNSDNKIKTLLKIDKNSFFLPENILSSSKNINKQRWVYTSWASSILYYANDTFYFNILNNTQKEEYLKYGSENVLNFLTKKEIENNDIYNTYGMIGLKLISKENETKYPDFIRELKREKIIDSYRWSIKYNYIKGNYFEGEFLIGNDIDKYLKNDIENNYDIRMFKAQNRKNELYWDIKFKNIFIGNKPINEGNKYSLQGSFDPKLNIIIGTTEFRYAILNHFFNNYIYKKVCYEEKLSFYINDYYVINCKKKDFNITEFPYISFRLQFYSFSFSYKDLFYEDENDKDIYHFLIIFNKDYYDNNNINEYWTFGLPFLNKYILIFDSDSKLIIYYSKNKFSITSNNNKNEKYKNNEKKEKDFNINNNTNNKVNKDIRKINNNGLINNIIYILIIFGIILGCGLLILFGMKIQKIIIKKKFPTLNLNRKKHKNELSCELEQMNKDNNLLSSD